MSRLRGENLRSVYVLLFLNIAFFFFEQHDPQHYINFFCFDRTAVFTYHQWWRLVTYQFVQGGTTIFFFPPPVALFFNLILLHLFGGAIEEDLGTKHFLIVYALSLFGSAGVAAILNVQLLGTFFLNYTLIFIAATLFANETLYLLMIVPIRVTWVAIGIAVWLMYNVLIGRSHAIAALGGAALSYGYFLALRLMPAPRPKGFSPPKERDADALVQRATRNLARVAAVKNALTTANDGDIDRLITLSQGEIVSGVNICPPADYKPEHTDGYCVRCDGFAECTARHLRLNRPPAAAAETS